jgi:hypothetical protein
MLATGASSRAGSISIASLASTGSNEPLFAASATETLRISRGEMLTYVHIG